VLDKLAKFFGSKEFTKHLSGRRWARLERLWRIKLWLEPAWGRKDGHKRGNVAKSGKQPPHKPPHRELIEAMRASMPSPPEVPNPELIKSYRKLLNKRKALRKLFRA
jgi:hypothetical protein